MTVLLGPVIDHSGDPVPMDPKIITRAQAHLRRTRFVVDDFGNAVAYERRCSACLCWLPLQLGVYETTRKQGRPPQLGYECRECARWRSRAARRDPVKSEQMRLRKRNATTARRADPEYRKVENERRLERKRRRKQEDPERMRELERLANKRYRDKLKTDPARQARLRESRRLAYRLKAEQQRNVHVDNIRTITPVKGHAQDIPYKTTVPGPPLAEAITIYATHSEDGTEKLCKAIGVSSRALRRWRAGEGTHIDSADKALTVMKLAWWEVWTPGSPDYEAARAVFEAENLRRAA